MNEWFDFFMAIAGGAATLTGLIFVGVSINLTKILSMPTMPNRALISMILLLLVLVLSILFLVPGQSIKGIGIQVLALSFIVWVFVTHADFTNVPLKENKYRRFYILNMVLDQIAIVPYFIGGVAILLIGDTGFYWTIPAIVFSFIKSVIDAWILLVEINR